MGFPEGFPFPARIEVGMGRTGKLLRSRLMGVVEEDPSSSNTHDSASNVARSKMRRAVGDAFSSTTG